MDSDMNGRKKRMTLNVLRMYEMLCNTGAQIPADQHGNAAEKQADQAADGGDRRHHGPAHPPLPIAVVLRQGQKDGSRDPQSKQHNKGQEKPDDKADREPAQGEPQALQTGRVWQEKRIDDPVLFLDTLRARRNRK